MFLSNLPCDRCSIFDACPTSCCRSDASPVGNRKPALSEQSMHGRDVSLSGMAGKREYSCERTMPTANPKQK
jgi:hypothetical protein